MKLLYEIYPYIFYFTFISIVTFTYLIKKNKPDFVLLYFEIVFLMDFFSDVIGFYLPTNYIVYQYGVILINATTLLTVSTQLNSKKVVYSVYFTILSFLFFCVYVNVNSSNDSYPSLTHTVGGIITIIYSLYYYYELFSLEKEENLAKNGTFWIISVFFFYNSGVFFLNLTFSKILSGKISAIFDTLNVILTYIYFFVSILGLYLIYKLDKTKNKSLIS